MSMIYFGMTSEALESLTDDQLKEVFSSLNKFGNSIVNSYISKLPEDNRLRKIYNESSDLITIIDWVRSGFSPSKFSESFNIDDVDKGEVNPVLDNPNLELLFNKAQGVDKLSINHVAKSLIKENFDFYLKHYKEANDLSYWRKL